MIVLPVQESDSDLTQRDNIHEPFKVCYLTSLSIVSLFILTELRKTKLDLGCTADKQLADFYWEISESKDVREKIKIPNGWRPRAVADVIKYIFNTFFNRFGFACDFSNNYNFVQYKDLIVKEGLPQILHGDFKLPDRTLGHVVVGIGFHEDNFVVHDPFGNFYTHYEDKNGRDLIYEQEPFLKEKNKFWLTTFRRT